MKDSDYMGDAEAGGATFAEMMEQYDFDRRRLRPGEKIEAPIIKISDEWVFIDLAEKSEGYIDKAEFIDADGNLTVQEGDIITAYFLSSKRSEKLFTTKLGNTAIAGDHLKEAFQNKIPVEGVIEKEVKGGFEIKIAGSFRAFCPYSQLALEKSDTEEITGRRFDFQIIEYGEKGRNIVLSRRPIVEEEKRREKEALKETLGESMVLKGRVVSIQKFGAFVDIGGIHGLLPVSEMSWGRVDDVADVLSLGDELTVQIIKIDWERDRITLSLKSILADPWEEVEKKYLQGAVYSGEVVRLTKFGAFVELEPGIDGLVHISQIGRGKKIKHPSDVLSEKERLSVIVESIDADKKRISLRLADQEQHGGEEAPEDRFREYAGSSNVSMGTLGDVLRDKLKKKKK